MKVYENVTTYFPLVYLFLCQLIMIVYHYTNESPFVLNSLILLNTYLLYEHPYHSNSLRLHNHLWKASCLIVYGVLFNEILTKLFENYYMTSELTNVVASALYCLVVFKFAYFHESNYLYDVSKRDSGQQSSSNHSSSVEDSSKWLLFAHVYFGYLPFRQMHQINIHVFVLYCIIHFVMLYHSLGKTKVMMQKHFYRMPLNLFFMYLRVQEWFLVVGVLQLYMEYRKIYHKQNEAILAEYAYLEKTHENYLEKLKSIPEEVDDNDDDDDDDDGGRYGKKSYSKDKGEDDEHAEYPFV